MGVPVLPLTVSGLLEANVFILPSGKSTTLLPVVRCPKPILDRSIVRPLEFEINLAVACVDSWTFSRTKQKINATMAMRSQFKWLQSQTISRGKHDIVIKICAFNGN